MSMGERSCAYFANGCPCYDKNHNRIHSQPCTVKCIYYIPNGRTPDSSGLKPLTKTQKRLLAKHYGDKS